MAKGRTGDPHTPHANAQAPRTAAPSADQADMLLQISAELTTTLDLDRVLNRGLELARELTGAERGSILVTSPQTEQLMVRASFGSPEPVQPGGRRSSGAAGAGLAGWVMAHRQAVVVDDLQSDERWVSPGPETVGLQSALAVPLVTAEQARGALILLSQARGAFQSQHVRLASAIAHQIASAVNNAELYDLIRDQAERLGSMVRSQQVEASQSQAILNAIADGVIVTDAQHKIVLFNPAAERILALDRSEALGRPLIDFIGVFGAAGARWAEAMRTWAHQPPASATGASFQERIDLDTGRVISVSPAAVVLGDDFLGTVTIIRDITREVEVDRLKSEFVATVSHELRTPMTSIKGFVDLLLMGASGELNEEQRHFLEIVRKNTERLEVLVTDLLDISRIEAGKVGLEFEGVDLSAVLEEQESFLEHLMRSHEKPMNLSLTIEDDLPQVWADPVRVRQILANLLENAFQYTPAGGQIDLRASSTEGVVQLEVSDNGIGIPLAEQERIFERFFRGESALNLGVPGTGLGLSIVLNLVEMQGGRLWVSSEGVPGKGTTFTVTLPAAPNPTGNPATG